MATQIRSKILAENMQAVRYCVSTASDGRPVRLVAVSKLKPSSDILALYEKTGHTHMGENYVQELLDKASQLPREINWHFIGQLQTNKCKQLAEKIPNLWAVESVDACKKADALEKGRGLLMAADSVTEKLRVFVQVNTSGEASKSGCLPSDVLKICRHVQQSCPHLLLQGLMTIGSLRSSVEAGTKNPDFELLRNFRDATSSELNIPLELSMGMTQDFQAAIQVGATNVRVGTAIFGDRPTKEARS